MWDLNEAHNYTDYATVIICAVLIKYLLQQGCPPQIYLLLLLFLLQH